MFVETVCNQNFFLIQSRRIPPPPEKFLKLFLHDINTHHRRNIYHLHYSYIGSPEPSLMFLGTKSKERSSAPPNYKLFKIAEYCL